VLKTSEAVVVFGGSRFRSFEQETRLATPIVIRLAIVRNEGFIIKCFL
jgi:hypothetical protein